jgi:hypothetical protein
MRDPIAPRPRKAILLIVCSFHSLKLQADESYGFRTLELVR